MNVIDHFDMVRKYYTPKHILVQHEMNEFMATDKGEIVTPAEKRAQREFVKAHFHQLSKDVLEVFEKASRERLAHHEHPQRQ